MIGKQPFEPLSLGIPNALSLSPQRMRVGFDTTCRGSIRPQPGTRDYEGFLGKIAVGKREARVGKGPR
jgi:hypothetical protein